MARAKKEADLTPEERLQAALVPDWEWPYKLPENWCWTYLGVVSEIVMGQSPAGKSTTNDSSYMPLIGGAADMGELYPQVSRFTKTPTKQSQTDDVILSIRATLGRPIFSDGIYCLGRGVVAFRSSIVTKEFLRYFFIDQENYLYQNATGTTFAQVDSKTLKSMPFPLPPFHEQRRIVRRVESLFTKLDEAKDKAQKVVDEFKTRKAAILHQAFTGELTAKWREEHGVGMDSWEKKSVGELCISLKYGTAKKSDASGNVVVLRMGNLQQGEIDWSDLAYSNDPDDIEKYKLFPGDVLFNRTNSAALVGKTAIYRGEHPAIYAGYLIKLDYDHDKIIGDYLNYALNTLDAKKYCNSVKTDGVNQSNINAKKIGAYSFNVPSIPEQEKIVSVIQKLLSKEQQTKEAAEVVLDQIDLMKKSILARAFRGELGTNDPNEESAVELLKEIMSYYQGMILFG